MRFLRSRVHLWRGDKKRTVCGEKLSSGGGVNRPPSARRPVASRRHSRYLIEAPFSPPFLSPPHLNFSGSKSQLRGLAGGPQIDRQTDRPIRGREGQLLRPPFPAAAATAFVLR